MAADDGAKPTPTRLVGLRLGRGLLDKIDQLARAEQRTRSNMMTVLLRDAADRRRVA